MAHQLSVRVSQTSAARNSHRSTDSNQPCREDPSRGGRLRDAQRQAQRRLGADQGSSFVTDWNGRRFRDLIFGIEECQVCEPCGLRHVNSTTEDAPSEISANLAPFRASPTTSSSCRIRNQHNTPTELSLSHGHGGGIVGDRVDHRSGRDSEASREGRREVTSRSTGRATSLRRLLSLMSAAAACEGCARGGGSGARDRGSGGAVKGNACWSLAAFNPGSRWKRANAHWSPKPYRDTVLAWSRKEGNSYSSDAQRVSGVRIQLSPTPALNWH